MIDIYELNKNRDLRFQRRIEVYKVFLKRCIQKIKSLSSDREFCTYQVPLIAAGVPLFDRNKCIYYIYHKLIKIGFKVCYTENLSLFIYWGHIPSYVKKQQQQQQQKQKQNNLNKNSKEKPKNQYRDITEHANLLKNNFIYDFGGIENSLKAVKKK